jgi:hypothetical protein
VHFLAGAICIFLWFSLVGGSQNDARQTIVIDEEEIQRLWTNWMQSWRKPPTQAQLAGLIENAVREEVYYREALRLGLNQNDPIVRNRMVQKMRFLQAESMQEPTVEDLRGWLQENADDYVIAPRYSFEQVYLGQDIDASQAQGKLDQLRKDPHVVDQIRVPLSLPMQLENASVEQIERHFGREFSVAMAQHPLEKWVGPIASGFGQHLVLVTGFEPAKAGSLEDDSIRKRVANDWRADSRRQIESKNYAALKDNYTIEIAQPQ